MGKLRKLPDRSGGHAGQRVSCLVGRVGHGSIGSMAKINQVGHVG